MQSYCFLCPSVFSPAIAQRMQALVDYSSGFEVAEVDLQLRGPGDMSGLAQSGLPDFRMASLSDVEFFQEVHRVADEYLAQHPDFITHLAETSTYSYVLGGLE
jgi:ATP-dependent DNA helicase RecG